jgi:hypothetical protein
VVELASELHVQLEFVLGERLDLQVEVDLLLIILVVEDGAVFLVNVVVNPSFEGEAVEVVEMLVVVA